MASANLPNNWLFVLTREQNFEVVGRLYLDDISDFPERYNQFVLLEGEGDDIDFPSLGDYQYDVYQMPDGGSTDETLGQHVEIGKIRVFDAEDEENQTYNAQITSKVYER